MDRDEENPKVANDEHPGGEQDGDVEDELEKKKRKQAEIEENPDLEDPRLYSPLQEPDRPAPEERSHGEEDKATTGANESSSSNDEETAASSERN